MQGQIQPEARSAQPVYVGIDVCKERLDVYLHPLGQQLSVANDRSGIQRLKRQIARHPVALVVIEATAKYHRLAHRSLSQSGVAVAVVNPLRSRLFAEAFGTRAKTDRVDAKMLALLGDALAPPATPPAPAALQELVHARCAATAERTALANRLAASHTAFLKAELRRRLISLERHIARLAAAIAKRIAADPVLARRRDILVSIPGIGPVVAASLLVDPRRARPPRPPRHRLPGRTGSLRRRQRRSHRPAPHQGRARPPPPRPLLGRTVRRPLQSRSRRLLQTSVQQRQKAQGRARRRHAKARRPRQHTAQRRQALGQSLCLTANTDAHP